MEKMNEKKAYVKPELRVIQVELEQGIAAGSNGSVQPGGGSGVTEGGWNDGGTETQDPSGEWWK